MTQDNKGQIQSPGDYLPRDYLSGKWPRGHFENFDVDKITLENVCE